jgi:hypothetical protein
MPLFAFRGLGESFVPNTPIAAFGVAFYSTHLANGFKIITVRPVGVTTRMLAIGLMRFSQNFSKGNPSIPLSKREAGFEVICSVQ